MDKQVEQATKADSELFFDAFYASPIGIALEDLDGRPLFVNPALCAMLGFTEAEMRDKHCVQFSPDEDAEKDWALFAQLRSGLINHYELEKRYFRRDGSLVWGRLSISLLGKREPPLVVAMVEDITEKRMAQDDLRQSEANLRKLAAQLQQRTHLLRRLASDLTLAEQRAREQLAKTLHDHLQQLLASAQLNVDRVVKRISGHPEVPGHLLESAKADISEAIAASQSLAVQLFPPVLHGGTLSTILT